MKITFDPIYIHPLPEGHRFPMLKYKLIPEQLMYEETITQDHLFAPPYVLMTSYYLLIRKIIFINSKNQQLYFKRTKAYRLPANLPSLTLRLVILQALWTAVCTRFLMDLHKTLRAGDA